MRKNISDMQWAISCIRDLAFLNRHGHCKNNDRGHLMISKFDIGDPLSRALVEMDYRDKGSEGGQAQFYSFTALCHCKC